MKPPKYIPIPKTTQELNVESNDPANSQSESEYEKMLLRVIREAFPDDE